jgi:PhnB protein
MEFAFHLCFAGECEAAFRFYERVLAGSLTLLTYADSPAAATVPPEWSGKVVHATLSLGNRHLAGADVLPHQYKPPQGFFILLNPATLAEAERIFTALAEKGTVQMPLQKTFWSQAFGVLVDRFGVPWEISCETPR